MKLKYTAEDLAKIVLQHLVNENKLPKKWKKPGDIDMSLTFDFVDNLFKVEVTKCSQT